MTNPWRLTLWFRDAFNKKNCWEGHIGPYMGEGGRKIPFPKPIKKGTYSYGGSKSFCHMLHIQFCISVSTQFQPLNHSKISKGHRLFINLPIEKFNLSLLPIFYVPILLVPYLLGVWWEWANRVGWWISKVGENGVKWKLLGIETAVVKGRNCPWICI